MFEDHPHELETMLERNAEFRLLYRRHLKLDNKLRSAELGILPLDDTRLAIMKKEKLRAKDKLMVLWSRFQAVT